MARHTTAVCRLCRRAGDKLMLKGAKCISNCTFEKRPKPPGPHINQRRRISDRGVQLREKQKARRIYGTMERQFRRIFAEAEKQPGSTVKNLNVLLERRLDNVVNRLGFADSRSQARQLVRHGHITLNGHRTNTPSALVKEGDAIAWSESSTKHEYYKTLVESIKSKTVPTWLSLDRDKMVGKVLSIPAPEVIEVKFDVKAIVEYYSR